MWGVRSAYTTKGAADVFYAFRGKKKALFPSIVATKGTNVLSGAFRVLQEWLERVSRAEFCKSGAAFHKRSARCREIPGQGHTSRIGGGSRQAMTPQMRLKISSMGPTPSISWYLPWAR